MVLQGSRTAPEPRGESGVAAQPPGPQQPLGVLSLPARWKGAQPAGAGLSNLGNSCYLNSTLQCLAYVPPLAHLCLSRAHSATCPRSASLPGSPPCAFCLLERQLSAQLRAPRGSCVSPGEVVRQLPLFGRSFVRGRQEDSHEFLTALLDVVEREERRAAGGPKNCRTLIEDLFLGRWQSQVRCLACGHESNSYEGFATLPLDIGQARTVSEGLHAFTEAERLDGANRYKCDRCRQLVPALKQTTIWDEPNVLVLHLKRFDAGSLLGKVGRHVGFPEALDLQPFMTPADARSRAERQGQAGQQGDCSQQSHQHQQQHLHQNGNGHHHSSASAMDVDAPQCNPNPNPDPSSHFNGHYSTANPNPNGIHNPNSKLSSAHHPSHPSNPSHPNINPSSTHNPGRPLYRLTGVLVHCGSSLHSGHYYALVRDSEDRWAAMNDSCVTATSLEQVRQEQAYLLFYTRTSMKLPRPAPGPQPQPAPGPDQQTTATTATTTTTGVRRAAQVYGPQLPAHLARRLSDSGSGGENGGLAGAAAAKVVGSSSAAPSRFIGPQLPARQQPAVPLPLPVPSRGGVVGSGMSAKLPAKLPPSAAAAAAALPPPPPLPLPQKPPLHADSRPAGEGPGPSSSSRKRKAEGPALHEPESSAAAAAATTTTSEPQPQPQSQQHLQPQQQQLPPSCRAAVESQLAALKACASWGEGAKRLRLSLDAKLRQSEWLGKVREVVGGMKAAGLSLQEVLATRRDDPRRQGLQRGMPAGVLLHGKEALEGMLKGLLPLLMLPVWLLAAAAL